jgi:hypothetical protein
MGTLVGVVWARPNGRPQAAATTKRITIPAGWFHPVAESYNYRNFGYYIESYFNLTSEYFTAPVVFPSGGQKFTVEKIALYAFDNNGAAQGNKNACVILYKTNPLLGAGPTNQYQMANACSTGSSATDPRTFTTTTINNNPVGTARGAYLRLTIQDNDNLRVYAVTIWYHKGSP